MRIVRSIQVFTVVGVFLSFGCVAETPTGTTPDERCAEAHDLIGTCVEEYCLTAAADDPLCIGGGATLATDGSCSERTAGQADRFRGQSCDVIIADLQLNGGKADGWCPSFLCWLCDCEEEQADCCIDCSVDISAEDGAVCRLCFDTYGHDTDGDGQNDKVWTLYCTGRCGGCIDTDCDGECDPAE